ncbi:MAG: hypothetical protein K9L75_02705 [Spirochaetia bacterium]|nr:hypothetical protein [Spirochaetia bacterium]
MSRDANKEAEMLPFSNSDADEICAAARFFVSTINPKYDHQSLFKFTGRCRGLQNGIAHGTIPRGCTIPREAGDMLKTSCREKWTAEKREQNEQ